MEFKRFILIFILILLFPFIHFGQTISFEYHAEKIRKKIHKIVQKIAEREGIDTEVVGFEVVRTKQYDRFTRLVKKSTIEELDELTNHPNSAVRGYAFWGLAKRYYTDLETIFIKHANDEAKVFFMDGCYVMDISVIDFMIDVVALNGLDRDCKKLSESAFVKIALAREFLGKKEDKH